MSRNNLLQGSYLSLLTDIEDKLPVLLQEAALWQSVNIDYHPPKVERVWLEYDTLRICLHRIYPAKPLETLFHAHPWPSAMKILKGTYETGIGLSSDDSQPAIATTLLLNEGDVYEMISPNEWHYVCPIGEVTYSLMISGPPWHNTAPLLAKKLLPLPSQVKTEILDFFKGKYK